jgi:hypothetical protein
MAHTALPGAFVIFALIYFKNQFNLAQIDDE